MTTREELGEARRVVVKIGSRSLLAEERRFADVAGQIARQHPVASGDESDQRNREIVLVSSGAIAIGRRKLGFTSRPKDMGKLQAAAAAGQSLLMRMYAEAFDEHGLHVAQVLLTHADLADRDRYLNARGALDALLDLRVVPIINENDTVAVEEIRFGDNDQLAAMVATLCGADLLVLLTDVEGLLDHAGNRVPTVLDTAAIEALVRPPTDDVGLGGMASKVEAARRATRRGVPVVIADARDPRVLDRILMGEDVGTLFLPHGSGMASRKHWIAFTLKPKGDVLVDAGAADAVREGKKSLLSAGVIGVRGDFEPGDAVRIVAPSGSEVARGLIRYGTRDVSRLAGAKSREVEARLGRPGAAVIVHRDDLVVP